MSRGKYILFEGGEGCGKSYQSRETLTYLQKKGIPCVTTREPGGTPGAEQVRRLILDPTEHFGMRAKLFLFEAARAEIYEKVIIPALEAGTSVVADRSGYSTIAYQGYGEGLDLGLIKRANEVATMGLRPDLLFILNVSPEVGLGRSTKNEFGKPDSIEALGLKFHRRVHRGYMEIARENSDIAIVVQDIPNGQEKMQEEIRTHLRNRIGF
ncbi:MAG: dTMP kinase [Nanoarchaeota archaeon]|nr:dTMP kinase [Nanoarchaeota archaeon]